MSNGVTVAVTMELVFLKMTTVESRLVQVTDLEARLPLSLGEAWTARFVALHSGTLVLELRLAGVVGNLRRSFDELNTHTKLGMPEDMAMHKPSTRVVGLETDNGVSWLSCTHRVNGGSGTVEENSVTSHRVVEIERWDISIGKSFVVRLSKDSEVMAVKMHRVRRDESVLDDPVNPLVCGVVEDRVTIDLACVILNSREQLESWSVECNVDELGCRSVACSCIGSLATKEPSVDRGDGTIDSESGSSDGSTSQVLDAALERSRVTSTHCEHRLQFLERLILAHASSVQGEVACRWYRVTASLVFHDTVDLAETSVGNVSSTAQLNHGSDIVCGDGL